MLEHLKLSKPPTHLSQRPLGNLNLEPVLMEELSGKTGVERLDLDNYHTWSIRVECLLVSKGLWDHTQTTGGTDRAGDAKARAGIGMHLAEQHLETFAEHKTAKLLWEALADLFKTKSQARRLQLKQELSALHLESGEPLVKYMARAKRLQSQLRAAGTTMDEDELCLSVLSGLPAEFAMITTVLTAAEKKLTLEDTLAKLLFVETNQSKITSGSKAYTPRPEPAAGRAHGRPFSGQKPKETRKCHHCGKPGHIKADCFKRQREEAGSGSRPQGQGFKGANRGSVAAAAHQTSKGLTWILDSGASNHITGSESGMTNLRVAPAGLSMTFGNGVKAKVEAVGDMVLGIPGSDFQSVTLGDVFYIPEASMNMFSIRAAVTRGINVHFSRDKRGPYCRLEKDGGLMVEANADCGVFTMEAHLPERAMAAVESPELWHRRFGHLGFDNLVKLADGHLVSGMKPSAADFKAAGKKPCGTCITSKQHKATRPPSDSDTKRPLELLHTDVCGPIQVQSLGGSCYLATYLDDYSKMFVVRPIRYKSDVPALIKEVVTNLEKQSGQDLLVLRSDNGTEYLNRDLGDFLKSKGIQHQTTARYTPEQNGAAERLNRTIMDRVRAMLEDSGLGKELTPLAPSC